MRSKIETKEPVRRDDDGLNWGERNGPTIFGISVFLALLLVGILMGIAG